MVWVCLTPDPWCDVASEHMSHNVPIPKMLLFYKMSLVMRLSCMYSAAKSSNLGSPGRGSMPVIRSSMYLKLNETQQPRRADVKELHVHYNSRAGDLEWQKESAEGVGSACLDGEDYREVCCAVQSWTRQLSRGPIISPGNEHTHGQRPVCRQRHSSETNHGMLQLDSKIACQVKITGQVASCSESGAIANFWQYPTLGNSWQRWCVANSQLLALANSWQRQQLRQYNWRNVANAAQADPQYQPVRNNIRSRVQLVGLGVALIGVAIECHNNPGE